MTTDENLKFEAENAEAELQTHLVESTEDDFDVHVIAYGDGIDQEDFSSLAIIDDSTAIVVDLDQDYLTDNNTLPSFDNDLSFDLLPEDTIFPDNVFNDGIDLTF